MASWNNFKLLNCSWCAPPLEKRKKAKTKNYPLVKDLAAISFFLIKEARQS